MQNNHVTHRTDPPRPLAEHMKACLLSEVEPFVQESTYRSYLEGLNSNFYPEPIARLTERELNTQVIEEYYISLLSRKSRQTTVIMVTLLKRLSSYLYDRRLIDENYAKDVSLPRRRRQEFDFEVVRNERLRKKVFSEDDIRKFYHAYKTGRIEASESVAEWLPLILLQLETFMRAGEVLSIFLENIDFKENVIWVRNSVGKRFHDNDSAKKHEQYLKLPKNGASRAVPMSPLAREAVERMKSATTHHADSNPLGLLYPYPETGRLRSIDAYERNFKKICEALSVDRDPVKTDCLGRCYGLNTHALRHTGITLANTARDANIVNTALMAGHSVRHIGGRDIGAESAYIHADLAALRSVKTPSMLLGLGDGPGGAGKEADDIARLMQSKEIRFLLQKLLTGENQGIIMS